MASPRVCIGLILVVDYAAIDPDPWWLLILVEASSPLASASLFLRNQTLISSQTSLSSTTTFAATSHPAVTPSYTIELVTTITATTPILLDLGGVTELLIQGPTTLSTEFPAWFTYSPVQQDGTYFVSTFSYLLTAGTRVLDIPVLTSYSPVTLIGPTDYVVTYTQIGLKGDTPGPIAGNDSNSQCSPSKVDYPNQYLTYVTQLASLPAGQTSVVNNWWAWGKTLVGPTIISETNTYNLYEDEYAAQIGHLNNARCGGACGVCFITFPIVKVYYWPVANPNKACFNDSESNESGNITSTAATAQMPQIRGLTGLPEGISTFVSDDFTFTSPSIYIAFETVSAIDSCGIVGSPHYSTTLAFAPEDVSTLADLGQPYREGEYLGQVFSSFNFADVHCPPPGRVAPYSIVGQTGYSPVISPPTGLSSIDLAWLGSGCVPVQFQGNDPPHAIMPQSNPDSFPTSINPPVSVKTASPNSGVPAIPAKTTMVSTPQETTMNVDPPAESSFMSSAIHSQSLSNVLLPGPSADHSQVSQNYGSQAAETFVDSTLDQSTRADDSLISAQAPVIATTIPSSDYTLVVESDHTIIIDSSTFRAIEITIGSSIVTANSASAFIFGSQTLTPGDPSPVRLGIFTFAGHTFTENTASKVITVSGTPISLESTPTAVIIGGGIQAISSSTIDLDPPAITPVDVGAFTFGGQTYTANSASDFVIGSLTLTRGAPAITISGTPISLAPAGTDVIIGSSTQGVGDLIMSGFAGGNPTTNFNTVNPFLGVATRGAENCIRLMLLLMTGSVVLLGMLGGGYWIL